MGFAEIQAAFAAQAAGQPAPAAPTLAPSPFQPQPAAQFVQPPAAPTGPAAAPPGTGWPPINPPGERAPLAAPAATLAPPDAMMTVTAPTVSAPPEAEPKAKRTRKPRGSGAVVITGQTGVQTVESELVPSLAAEGAAVAQLPADGSTVEDIVQELFARGVSSVHLTFSREDGK